MLEPIYEQMKKEAAQGKVFQIDDTPVRIMELVKENKEKKQEKEDAEKKVKEKKGKRKKKKKEERVGVQRQLHFPLILPQSAPLWPSVICHPDHWNSNFG